MNELDEQLYDVEEEGFRVDSDQKADWCVKKIKEEEKNTQRIIDLAEQEIERLTVRIAEEKAKLDQSTSYLKYQLYQFFRNASVKETKTQESYQLLSGKLVRKKPSQKMVPDKERLIEMCEANNMPEFIKIKKDFDWASYKKECEIVGGRVVNVQTGDILDCISVEDVPESFEVK